MQPFSPHEQPALSQLDGESIADMDLVQTAVTSPTGYEVSLINNDSVISANESFLRRAGNVVTQVGVCAVAGGTYIFEQSPANEAIRAGIAVGAYERLGSAAAAGASVVATTFAIEAVSGMATAATISMKTGFIGRVNKWVVDSAEKLKLTNDKGDRTGDVLLGLGGGASVVVAKRHAVEGGRTFEESRKTALKAASGIAAFSGSLAVAAAYGVQFGAAHGHAEVAQQALDIISDGKTWFGLYAGMQVAKLSKKAIKSIYHRVTKTKPINRDPSLI